MSNKFWRRPSSQVTSSCWIISAPTRCRGYGKRWKPQAPGCFTFYSPDFNPIEQLFAKLKALLRKAAEHSARPLETASRAFSVASEPDEYANYFRNLIPPSAALSEPAETLLDGSPIEQGANRLGALSSALSRGNNEETRHRASQIAKLKAG